MVISGPISVNASNVLGYTVPKALRGKWYYGNRVTRWTTHTCDKTVYGKKYPTGKMVITRHPVIRDWFGLRTPSYYDGLIVSGKNGGFDFGFLYTPVVFKYKGHNHKGLDVTGHDPDILDTKKNFHKHLALYNHVYGNTQVKLMHTGW